MATIIKEWKRENVIFRHEKSGDDFALVCINGTRLIAEQEASLVGIYTPAVSVGKNTFACISNRELSHAHQMKEAINLASSLGYE